MTHLRDAIDHYHTLLDDPMGHDSLAQLSDQQQRRHLFFGERPLCTVLRPRFLTVELYQRIQASLRHILPALDRAHRAALADTAFRAQFGLTEWEERLMSVDPGFRAPSPTARMDMFVDPAGDAVVVTEYNAETPAAIAYNDVLSEAFYGLPVMRAFERRYEIRPLPGRHRMLGALLDAYAQWGGRDRPRIAILDWREVPTYSEFVLFQDYFESQGYECVIADPRGVEYRDGKLLVDGVLEVHLIYKRVLLSELVDRCGLDHAVIRAVNDGAVCMVNPYRCKILHKKASLAVLSDEANASLFTTEQRRAIQAHVPWTRRVRERRTRYQGQDIDLLPFVSAHKDEFVLKPNDEYGGKGIVLGWQASQAEWDAALQTGLREPAIVQARVPLPTEPYPSLVDGRVQVADRLMDTNPFVWYGEYASGCLTRLSTAALLNVTAGGGSTVPTFIIEDRG